MQRVSDWRAEEDCLARQSLQRKHTNSDVAATGDIDQGGAICYLCLLKAVPVAESRSEPEPNVYANGDESLAHVSPVPSPI